ncbi:MAG: hypothetical protein RMJ98_03155 [Myxococcales bacterium]|nr:hypothetical protein [Polyangiaceae bacterium]MDW8248288.1 hypothetical protein [Myxococcales bacterium]
MNHEELPYRQAPAEAPSQSLVFYPGIPLSEGFLRLAAAVACLLSLLVGLATFRLAATWLILPMLFLVLYATRGERYEVEVTEREVILRRSLWPFAFHEWRLPRESMLRVFIEEYDGEARLVFETLEGQKLPLTEAFHANRRHIHELQARLSAMMFPERALPPTK